MHLCTSLHVVAASRVQNHHNTLGLQEKVSTLSIEHHFCWKSAILSTFMSVAKHSANLLLVVVAACVVVQFSHPLSCMWLGVTQSALATRVVEEMSRFSSILLWMLACSSSCWRMIPLHLWAKTAFPTRRLAEKSRRVERCNFAVGGGTSGSSPEGCWEVFTLHPAKTKMTGWKILKMGDFPASHVSFQRCTGFNCQCVFLVCNLCKIMLFFSNSGESSQNWPWHWKISPISFFSSMYLCQNNPALKILTPQTWLCWGPGPDLCVIQVRSPFQEGGSDQLFGSSKSWECWDKP